MSLNIPECRYRASAHSYVVWTVIFGGLTALATRDAFNRHPSYWEAVMVFAGLLCFSIIWVRAFEIRITEDELVFRSLFGGTKRIAHTDIHKIRLGVDLSGKGGILQLLVEPKDRNARAMSINAKVFTSEAVRAVLDLGRRVATTDSGGLEEGLVMRTARKRRSRKIEPGG